MEKSAVGWRVGIVDRIAGILNVSRKQPIKTRIIDKIIEVQNYRNRQDIGKWRAGLVAAEATILPNRLGLYRSYADAVLDLHLTSVMGSRKNKIKCKKFKIVGVNGKEVEDKTKLLQSQWFVDFMDLSLDSIFWGHSLIQFGDLIDGKFAKVELVPREHVDPVKEIVRKHPLMDMGESYVDSPYSDWCIGVGKPKDLGLLAKATPMAIWKKNALSSWAEYGEMFGQPIRMGKTNIKDPQSKANMEKMLEQMGSCAWGVFDMEDTLELVETNKQDAYEVFLKLCEYIDGQFSKGIQGQTMTSDNGSSRSQAEVHEAVADEYGESDETFMANVINDKLIPLLIKHGFPLNGFRFEFDNSENLGLEAQFAIDSKLLEFYDIPEDYITEKYGTPVKKKAEPKPITPDGGPGVGKSQSSKTIINSIYSLYYADCCDDIGHIHNDEKEVVEDLFSDDWMNRFITNIYFGVTTTDALDAAIYAKIAEYLTKAVFLGYGKSLYTVEFGGPDYVMLEELRDNIYIFSGAKTYQQTKAIMALVLDADGNRVSFEDFKKAGADVFQQYNKKWLKTEYDLAVGQARSASYWMDIQRDKDVLPLLQYDTIGDGRVRDEHKVLEGIIRPVDDPFWDVYMPKNGWRCRCDVRQLDEGDVTNLDGLELPELPKVFQMNPGKDRMVFSPEHPYFEVEPKDQEKAKNNFNLPLPQ